MINLHFRSRISEIGTAGCLSDPLPAIMQGPTYSKTLDIISTYIAQGKHVKKKVQPLSEGAVQIKRKSEIAQFSNLSDAPCGISTSILKLGSG